MVIIKRNREMRLLPFAVYARHGQEPIAYAATRVLAAAIAEDIAKNNNSTPVVWDMEDDDD